MVDKCLSLMAPGWVGHILLSGHGRLLVFDGLPLCPMPCNTNGPAGPVRRPFS